MTLRAENSAGKTLLIAIDVPFVRFVTDLMPEARRDLKFCAE
jgi:hypothetical protein